MMENKREYAVHMGFTEPTVFELLTLYNVETREDEIKLKILELNDEDFKPFDEYAKLDQMLKLDQYADVLNELDNCVISMYYIVKNIIKTL